MSQEQLHYDVVIVGAGPAGLAAACRIRQKNNEISVCVLEKAAEIGAHSLSGALLQPTALAELFPDWKERGAPLTVPVVADEVHYLLSPSHSIRFPTLLAERVICNHGNYVISLALLVRWMAQQAEAFGVEIYPGFAAAELLLDDDGRGGRKVIGVRTGDMGVAAGGEHKPGYQPGIDILGRYTLLAEGCRGHLGKQAIRDFNLDRHSGTQHYALGIKELWQIDPDRHQPGKVVHSFGWPLARSGTGGGAFLYHFERNQVALGMITDLNYSNPYLSPFDELQLWKHHPLVRDVIEGGERIAYGARAINKGGLQAVPRLDFPGGLLLGCDAGFMNYPKIKGNHTAMKSGILAADAVVKAFAEPDAVSGNAGQYYSAGFKSSWLFRELSQARNVAPAMHRFGMWLGSIYSFLDYGILRGRVPYTLKDEVPDHQCLKPAELSTPPAYPKPDGKLTFDKLSSVYLSNTSHAEDQPCHLRLRDESIPLQTNLPVFDEPAQRYCPAGVYEVVEQEAGFSFQINSQNCVHCKTCDIKDPYQNITWVPPEGGGGPNYSAM